MIALIYRYGSICEPDIIDGLKQLDIEVLEIDIEVHDKTVLPSKTVKVVGDFLQDNPVDFVLSVNFYPALSEICNIYHIRYFSLTVDSPVLEIFTKSISNEWNRTFLFDRGQYNDVVKYNKDRIFHLPLAANPDAMKSRIKDGQKNKQKFSHDVSFVGSLYSEKCPFDKINGLSEYAKGFLSAMIRAQEKVYGYYFIEEALTDEIISEIKRGAPDFEYLDEYEHFLTDRIRASQYYIASKVTVNERHELFKVLSENVDTHIYTASDTTTLPKINNHGTCNTLTEMPVVFNSAKININTTAKAIRSGIPLRVFDVLSCGGFLISNYQTELTEFFTPGQDLIMYSSVDECVDLCKYYLDHEKERNEIAAAGYETLRKYHTYKIRLAQMITKGFEV